MSSPTTADTTRCFLLVEDEMLVAMMMEDVLTERGYDVRKAARLRDALALVESESFAAALLDVNLGGELVFPVAAALRKRNVPFAFSSGYGEQSIPPEYSDCIVLQKPYTLSQLTSTASKLLASPGSTHGKSS